ncbi:MAG: hypothetical protein MJ105_09375 [Lachnospiraceae bacterium]|nr:hypothetical protein [Lachnospiraceae bacterium]
MKKRIGFICCALLMIATLLVGCGAKKNKQPVLYGDILDMEQITCTKISHEGKDVIPDAEVGSRLVEYLGSVDAEYSPEVELIILSYVTITYSNGFEITFGDYPERMGYFKDSANGVHKLISVDGAFEDYAVGLVNDLF